MQQFWTNNKNKTSLKAFSINMYGNIQQTVMLHEREREFICQVNNSITINNIVQHTMAGCRRSLSLCMLAAYDKSKPVVTK